MRSRGGFWRLSDGAYPEDHGREKKGMMDTVFNAQMAPVWSNEPAEVMRRLKYGHSDSWAYVCIGSTGKIVSVSEYLYADTYKMVVKELTELLDKKDLAMYRRSPERLQTLVERISRRLIDSILENHPEGK